MLKIRYTKKFVKDLKLMQKRRLDINLLYDVVKILVNNNNLPAKYKEHFFLFYYKRL